MLRGFWHLLLPVMFLTAKNIIFISLRASPSPLAKFLIKARTAWKAGRHRSTEAINTKRQMLEPILSQSTVESPTKLKRVPEIHCLQINFKGLSDQKSINNRKSVHWPNG